MVDNDNPGHLLLALKNGDAEAFTAIYKAYWYDMYLVAYRKLRNKEAAEEIVQDIFLRFWRERDTPARRKFELLPFFRRPLRGHRLHPHKRPDL
jgi:DNA-directed RNA polymerase specialized sigma24 family protein